MAFSRLPGDVTRTVFENISTQEILQKCTLDKKFNAEVCSNLPFWRQRAKNLNIPVSPDDTVNTLKRKLILLETPRQVIRLYTLHLKRPDVTDVLDLIKGGISRTILEHDPRNLYELLNYVHLRRNVVEELERRGVALTGPDAIPEFVWVSGTISVDKFFREIVQEYDRYYRDDIRHMRNVYSDDGSLEGEERNPDLDLILTPEEFREEVGRVHKSLQEYDIVDLNAIHTESDVYDYLLTLRGRDGKLYFRKYPTEFMYDQQQAFIFPMEMFDYLKQLQQKQRRPLRGNDIATWYGNFPFIASYGFTAPSGGKYLLDERPTWNRYNQLLSVDDLEFLGHVFYPHDEGYPGDDQQEVNDNYVDEENFMNEDLVNEDEE